MISDKDSLPAEGGAQTDAPPSAATAGKPRGRHRKHGGLTPATSTAAPAPQPSSKPKKPTIAGNYTFLADGGHKDWRQLQRCSSDMARNYRSKERLLEAAVNTLPRVNDRRAEVFAVVAERFGRGSAAGLNCERYLLDALFRWLLCCTRTRSSLVTYSSCMWRWCEHSDRRSLSSQADASPRDVMDFLFALENRDAGNRYVVKHREIIRSWFGWLEDRNLVVRSPITRDVRKAWRIDHGAVSKADGTRQAFTAAEAQAVIAYAFGRPPVECCSLMLEISTGARSDEVAAIPMSALVDRDGIVSVVIPGKGGKKRRVTLEPVAIAAWRRYQRERLTHGPRGGLLYPKGGGHYSARTIQSWAKAAARHVGRPEISSHDFRKTAATLRLENGWDIRDVAEELGHSNPSLTLRCYVVRKPRHALGTGLVAPTLNPEAQ